MRFSPSRLSRATRATLALAAFSAALAPATAQSLDEYDDAPETLVEAFARGLVEPPAAAMTGEAAENPISPGRLPKAPTVKAAPLWRGGGRALVALEFSNARSAQDLYAFVDSTGEGWRISAFRDVELPGVFYMQLNHYRNKGENAIRQDWDARFEASRARGVTREEHEAIHGTADDRVFFVFNLRLASSSDGDLVRHFEFLRERFDGLRGKIAGEAPTPLPLGHDSDVGDDLRYLLVKRAFHPADGPLRFEIASINGDDVGYLYCADADCVPTPTPGGVIALRDLGEGWWLYRTT